MDCYSLTIAQLRDQFKNGQINLEPAYQRKPAWKTRQRLLLLSSLFNGIPIPALIFHKHFNQRTKKDIYDVLDGKQRLETILHFIGLCPDYNSHFDLVNLYLNFFDININLKNLFKYLSQILYAKIN